ncbi:MAG TPA: tail fiber domain-containing protein [Kofleriaceae bacterium]|nr:tail fiber domain-containing protein [Kofleriaceae bacterium]
MKQLVLSLAIAVLLVTAGAAHAQAPQTVTFSARLTAAGAPLTGSHQLRFRLFTQVSGGVQRWEENHGSMALDDGLLHVGLGAITPLTTAILDGTPLFVEVELDGAIMSPRLQLRSVPYAVRATDAAQLGGVASTDYARTTHTHDRMGEIAIGAPVHGALPFAYETIQLNPGHNLRFFFGTEQRMVLGNDGRLQMAQTNGDCPTGWFCNGHFWDLTVASILYSGLAQRSDRRLKDDIRPDENGLAKVRALRPVTFAWKNRPAGATTDKREHGFIAQEVQQVIPELVAQTPDGMLSVETTAMIPILAQAVKELDAQNAQLRAELDELRRRTPAGSASPPIQANRTVLASLILLVGALLIFLLIRRA